jgi:hypothetical protein
MESLKNKQQFMLKKISIAVFWLAFFGFFLYKLIPKYRYLTDDSLKHWGSNTTFDNSIFALHIVAGIFVYSAAILQFTPSIRKNYISFHRASGKLYIFSSLLSENLVHGMQTVTINRHQFMATVYQSCLLFYQATQSCFTSGGKENN